MLKGNRNLSVSLNEIPKRFSEELIEKFKRQAITSGEFALDKKEIKKFLSVIDDMKHEVLFKLELATGMRRADIVAVERENINERKRYIDFIETKKNKIHRVYIGRELMNKLVQYINLERPSRWLFPSPKMGKFKNKHMHERQAHKIFQYYLRKAKLIGKKDNIPFHALRATCIKRALRKGWTVAQVAKLVDDKPKTIHEHYITPSIKDLKLVSEKIPL